MYTLTPLKFINLNKRVQKNRVGIRKNFIERRIGIDHQQTNVSKN